MSHKKLNRVLNMPVRWQTPQQFAVLVVLADKHNDEVGVAWPSIEKISGRVMLDERNVQRTLRELETLGLVKSHRPDRSLPPYTKTQRYELLLDADATTDRPLRQSSFNEGLSPPSWGDAGVTPPEGGNAASAAEEGWRGRHPWGDADATPGVTPASPDPFSDPCTEQERTATAAAQPRLPTPFGVKRQRKKSRRAKTNFRLLEVLAWTVLREPRRQWRYILERVTNDTQLYAAVKEFARRKRIAATNDEIARACASVWMKFEIPGLAAGTAVRPRDRRRAAAARRRL